MGSPVSRVPWYGECMVYGVWCMENCMKYEELYGEGLVPWNKNRQVRGKKIHFRFALKNNHLGISELLL